MAEIADDGSAGEAVRWSPDGLQVENVVWSPDSREVAWDDRSGVVVAASGQLLGTFNRQLWSVAPGVDGAGAGEPVSLTGDLDENAAFVFLGESGLLASASHRTGSALYHFPVADGRVAGPPAALTDGSRFHSSRPFAGSAGSRRSW